MSTPPGTDVVFIKSAALMGTVVSMQVVGHHTSQRARRERRIGVDRAFAWFERVEAACSRFDAASEVRRLSTNIGAPVPVSDLLFEVVQFALAVADATDGAFDPTVGHRMEARGFHHDYKSGADVRSGIEAGDTVSWRDVHLDDVARTITLDRPLLLDLGAVAKGLAVDMAARELAPFIDFAVDAGGDLFLGGHNTDGQAWSVGIRHPRNADQVMDTVHVSDRAVCTSGDYERRITASGDHRRGELNGEPLGQPVDGHHIMNPKSGASASAVASVTVIAPSAMVADALATAAFVLGPRAGLAFLEGHDVEGIIVTPALERLATRRHD